LNLAKASQALRVKAEAPLKLKEHLGSLALGALQRLAKMRAHLVMQCLALLMVQRPMVPMTLQHRVRPLLQQRPLRNAVELDMEAQPQCLRLALEALPQ
jgi:hypothetical protein